MNGIMINCNHVLVSVFWNYNISTPISSFFHSNHLKTSFKDLKYFKAEFDFSDLDPSHELFLDNSKKSYW